MYACIFYSIPRRPSREVASNPASPQLPNSDIFQPSPPISPRKNKTTDDIPSSQLGAAAASSSTDDDPSLRRGWKQKYDTLKKQGSFIGGSLSSSTDGGDSTPPGSNPNSRPVSGVIPDDDPALRRGWKQKYDTLKRHNTFSRTNSNTNMGGSGSSVEGLFDSNGNSTNNNNNNSTDGGIGSSNIDNIDVNGYSVMKTGTLRKKTYNSGK